MVTETNSIRSLLKSVLKRVAEVGKHRGALLSLENKNRKSRAISLVRFFEVIQSEIAQQNLTRSDKTYATKLHQRPRVFKVCP